MTVTPRFTSPPAQGDAEICRMILAADAQLDEYNVLGETPIQIAARAGHTDAVLALLNGWTIQRGSSTSLLNGFVESYEVWRGKHSGGVC